MQIARALFGDESADALLARRSDDPDAGIGQLGLEIAMQLLYTLKR